MKLKEHYEDFVSKALKEFYGLEYCINDLEIREDQLKCSKCLKEQWLLFEDFDEKTQRKIVSAELDRYA